ncbi:MAG: PIN domain-containing protein [Casimicrobium sp.]|jgi:predicted nucleic acid-binding protein
MEKKEASADWLRSTLVELDDLCINPVIFSELRLGVVTAKTTPLALARQTTVDRASKSTLLPIGHETALRHADITASLWRQNQKKTRPRANDLWIAATAMEHDLVLVTANVRDFADIVGLQLLVPPVVGAQ